MKITIRQLKRLIKEAVQDNYDLKLSSSLKKLSNALQDLTTIKNKSRSIVVDFPTKTIKEFTINFINEDDDADVFLTAKITNDNKLKCKLHDDYGNYECFDDFNISPSGIVSPNEIIKLCNAFLRIE